MFVLQILKQEWPHKWQKFIPDLVHASKTSETLCENSMVILKLLSEEVFDFSKDVLTQVGHKACSMTFFHLFKSVPLAGKAPSVLPSILQPEVKQIDYKRFVTVQKVLVAIMQQNKLNSTSTFQHVEENTQTEDVLERLVNWVCQCRPRHQS